MTRKRSRRILGMTVAQIFILLCLGCILLSTFGAGAWMVAGSMGLTFSAGPTAAPAPTSTPALTATLQPTITSTRPPTLTPTITPIPYESYVPIGWKQFRTEKVEIWLPENFAFVDNPELFHEEMMAAYSQIGLADLARQRQKNLLVYELLFRHGPPLGSHYVPSVFVKEFARNGLTLSQFVDKAIAALETNSTLVERRDFEFFEMRGERVMVQANYNNVYVNFIYYLVQDGNTIWEVGSDAHLNDFYSFESAFDEIAKTFRPVHKP